MQGAGVREREGERGRRREERGEEERERSTPLADRSICRLIAYTDTLAEWVYGYVDLAWLCLRIRRLGESCLRILSTDTTGIHVALGSEAPMAWCNCISVRWY